MLQINRGQAPAQPGGVEVTERWWRTEAGDRLVRDGDPDARFLYATPGMRVPHAEAVRYGLTSEPDEDQADAPEKEQPAPPNKAARRRPTKREE